MVVFLWLLEIVLTFAFLGAISKCVTDTPNKEKEVLVSSVVFVMMMCVLMFIRKVSYGG